MSALDAQLTRLTGVLSATERFLLELRLFKADQPRDPSLRQSMPPGQYAVFNRYVALKLAVNVALGEYITVVVLMIEKLHLRCVHAFTLLDSVLALNDLTKLIPAGKRKQAEGIAATFGFEADLPWATPDANARPWSMLCEEMLARVKRDLHSRWLDLQAIEAVLDEAAEEIDGEDLLHPYMRGELARGRELLDLLTSFLDCDMPTLAADDEALENARGFFESGRRIFD